MNVLKIVFGLSYNTGPGPDPFSAAHQAYASKIVHFLDVHALDGTVSLAVGTTARWGREASVVVETALDWGGGNHEDTDAVRQFVSSNLVRFRQEAAYVTIDGVQPQLWYSAGVSDIDIKPL